MTAIPEGLTDRPRHTTPILLLVLLVTVVYWPTSFNGFVGWDDSMTVAKNPAFDPPGWDTVLHCTREPHMALWVPLTYAVWTAIGVLAYRGELVDGSPLDPGPFHLANLILHAAWAAVVYRVLFRVVGLRAPALLGAAMTAVHPSQVEPVAWVSGLKDLRAAVLGWLTILLTLSGLEKRRRSQLIVAGLCLVLATLAKPIAVVTPVLLGAVLMAVGVAWRRLLIAVGVAVALVLPCLVWTQFVQAPVHEQRIDGLLPRLGLVVDTQAFYLGRVVWPWPLTVDHNRLPTQVLEGGWLISLQ